MQKIPGSKKSLHEEVESIGDHFDATAAQRQPLYCCRGEVPTAVPVMPDPVSAGWASGLDFGTELETEDTLERFC